MSNDNESYSRPLLPYSAKQTEEEDEDNEKNEKKGGDDRTLENGGP